jgi:hypothetical protein
MVTFLTATFLLSGALLDYRKHRINNSRRISGAVGILRYCQLNGRMAQACEKIAE